MSIRFLTVIPTFTSSEEDPRYFSGALYYFGITGIITGSIIAVFAWWMGNFVPPLVYASIVTVLLSLISGFLHLDGLADTADGFMSGRPAPICLDIMRDSRIGVMGAASIGSILLIKCTSIASIATHELLVAIIVASMAGRIAMVAAMTALPYARSDGGLGATFYGGANKSALLFSLFLLLVCLSILSVRHMIGVLFIFVFVVFISAITCTKKIGGATGDTLGALCEIMEAAVLIIFTIGA